MRKKNPLTVWTFPYRKSYYLLRPWKWFKDLYWNFRNFVHRGRYGYAYVDVWNFCDWYPRVAAEALRYLAHHSSGYPGVEPWETPDKWKRYLLEFAEELQTCADAQDIDFNNSMNEYWKIAEPMFMGKVEKDQEVIDKYWEREHELDKQNADCIVEVYEQLGKNLSRLWD